MFPSLVTAFTVIASLELAGRARGGTGLFGWIGEAAVARSVLRQCRAGDDHLRPRRLRRRDQRGLRDERDDPQHRVDPGSLPPDGGHGRRAQLHGLQLLAAAAAHRTRAVLAARGDRSSRICGSPGMQLFSIPNHIAGLHGDAAARLHGRISGCRGGPGVDTARQSVGRWRRDPVRLGDVLRRRARRHDAGRAARRQAADRLRRAAGGTAIGPSLWDRSDCGRRSPCSSSCSRTRSRSTTCTRMAQIPIAGVLAVLSTRHGARGSARPRRYHPRRGCPAARHLGCLVPALMAGRSRRRLRPLRVGGRAVHAAGPASARCSSCSSPASPTSQSAEASCTRPRTAGRSTSRGRPRARRRRTSSRSPARVLTWAARCGGSRRTPATSARATTAPSTRPARRPGGRPAKPASRCRAMALGSATACSTSRFPSSTCRRQRRRAWSRSPRRKARATTRA